MNPRTSLLNFPADSELPSRALRSCRATPVRPENQFVQSTDLKLFSEWIRNALVLVVLLGTYLTQAAQVTLTWDPNPELDIAGYRIYQGGGSRNYTNTLDSGLSTTNTVTGLVDGVTYFFAVTAYNTSGLESDFSNEITYTVVGVVGPTIALTSPSVGQSFTAPATVTVGAAVTANGNSITKVQFLNGATLLGEDTTTPYSFTLNDVAAGTFNFLARATYEAGQTVDSASVEVLIEGLPAPWKSADIGPLATVGSGKESNGQYEVEGAGKMGGMTDSLRFVYQPLTGDGEMVARISSVSTSETGGYFGVMIRESLSEASTFTFMGVGADGYYRYLRRQETGGGTSGKTSIKSLPANTWVRVLRKGQTLVSYRSSDGRSWTQIGSRNITMAPNTFIGFTVNSGNVSVLSGGTFTHVVVVP